MTVGPTAWLALLMGLAVGSFLNVCIHRLPRRESLVRPASRCPSCGRPLRWFENVPVISYLALRGRCAGCGRRISPVYPAVEIVTGALFFAAALQFEPGILLVARLVFVAVLVALFAIDLRHQILPNAITLPGIGAGFLFSLFAEPGWLASLLGALAGGGILFGLAEAYYRIRHEEGLGMGDVKMLAMIGAFLGWKLMLVSLVLASFAGSAVGIAIIVTRTGGLRYALPFGTFLALGAAAACFVGDRLLAWYLSFY